MSFSKKQLYKNSIWTVLELLSYPVLVFLATPFFIFKLGIALYGLWMLINTLTQGLNVLNFGLGDANIKLISTYRSNNESEKINQTFHNNFSLSIILFLLSVVLGYFLMKCKILSIFIQETDLQFGEKILFLTCVSVGIKFIEIAVLSVFKGFERFDVYSMLSLLSKSTGIFITVILFNFNWDLTRILYAVLVINFINIIIQIIVLLKLEKLISLRFNLATVISSKFFSGDNFFYWLQNTIGLVGFMSDKLIVAYFTNNKTVGYFYIASMLGTNIHNAFMAFGSFVFPRVSNKLQSNQTIVPLYYITRCLIVLIGWIIILFLLVFGKYIFELWLGETVYSESKEYINYYLIYIASLLLIITPYYFINASNQVKLNSWFELLLRGSHIVLMLLGNYFFGTIGIIYGLILSCLINIPIQNYFFHSRVLNFKNKEHLWLCLPVLLLVVIVMNLNLTVAICCAILFLFLAKKIYFDKAKPFFIEFLKPKGNG